MEVLDEEAFLPEPPREPGRETPDRVTIAIPTYNRSHLLRISLESALAQDYPHVQVMVLDNASTDDTPAVMQSCTDARVTYCRSETNLGMLANWNRAIELNPNPYLVVLQDDDILLPAFVSESLGRLKKYPRAALSYALARYIHPDGSLGKRNSVVPDDPGLVDGTLYLDQIIRDRGWTIGNVSSILFRQSALAEVGFFDSPHSRHSIEYNLFFRLAARFDVVPVPKELVYERIHPEALSETAFRSGTGTGPLGLLAERMDALALLLRSERAADPAYREWLAERLQALNARQSSYAYALLPGLYFDWHERRQAALREIAALVPAGASFVLADEEQWATGGEVAGRRAIPFPAIEGVYWGPPADDASAIAELENQRRAGINTVIFGWPAFWWLEHYGGLSAWLGARGQRIFSSPRLVAFRLSALS